MQAKYVIPKFQAPSFNCPRCHALTGQVWYPLFRSDGEGEVARQVSDGKAWIEEDPFPEPTNISWSASECFSCEKSSLWIYDRLVFPDVNNAGIPEVEEPNGDLPAAVLELYLEAAAVLPHSKRAAAALCRAALERLAKHLTSELPADLKLDSRLVHLGKSISSSTLQALNIVRYTGNTALHGLKDGDQSAVIYLDESDSTIATVFFAAINALADELITRPRLVQELYEQMPDGVRMAFDEKMKREVGE